MKYYISFLSISLYTLLALISCKETSDLKFEKNKWVQQEDPLYPPTYRAAMLTDLLNNYKIDGINIKELKKLLGEPDYNDDTSVMYKVSVKYGSDIDPVYSKNLVLSLSSDSSIVSHRITEWKK